ncbi:serum amyloid P-component-like [Alosa sapidissima]|uniref:serum amyloid P-component-like n=1 Tax=Alosa sapidissima TaxID=34773 RepID=UPI001C09EDDE|nr:serum amyloid P-component-like [Alosa sapidissima]
MLTLLFICVLASGCCYAIPQDMSGKVIIFPAETNTAHVKVTPAVEKIFFSVTVCLRFFSDYKKELTLFSLATRSHFNDFLLTRRADGNYGLCIADKAVFFNGLPNGLNEWNSVCVTWDSGTGLSQFWVNGKPSAKKALQAGGSIAGTPSIILGQEQDTYGGGFNTNDAFYGHVTDVHMWDNVLSPAEIQNYMKCVISRPGNVVDWEYLEYTRHGYVIVERNQNTICP